MNVESVEGFASGKVLEEINPEMDACNCEVAVPRDVNGDPAVTKNDGYGIEVLYVYCSRCGGIIAWRPYSMGKIEAQTNADRDAEAEKIEQEADGVV